MEENELEKRIVKAKVSLIRQQPFLGRLCTLLQTREERLCLTAGTDGEYLYYNPDFIKSLSEQELLFVIGHETLHCGLQHLWRREKRIPHFWNQAADFVVNLILKDNGFTVPVWALYDVKYHDMSAEQVYDKLPKTKLKCAICGGIIQEEGDQDQQEDKGGNSGNGKKEDKSGGGKKKSSGKNGKEEKACSGHVFWEKGGKDSKGREENKKRFEKLAKKWAAAVEESSKQRGDIPAGLERLFKHDQEKEDWKQIFANYLSSSQSDFDFMRRDRRTFDWDFYFPDMNDEEQLENVAISIDTSGSIDDKTMNKFMTEVKSIVKTFPKVKGWFMACDCKVSQFEELEKVSKIKSTYGYGGTSHVPVIEELKKRKITPRVLVCFTDLYTEFPKKKPDYPVLWLLTPDGSNEKPPFGRVIKMQK